VSSAGQIPLVFGAGLISGIVGTVAGMASLVSYPALLALGLSPVSANVTNTVGNFFTVVGGVAGSRPELAGQAERARKYLALSLLGGISGAALLLATPSAGFDAVVPFLVAGAAVLMLLRKRIQRGVERRRAAALAAGRSASRQLGPQVGVLLVGVYGGYFGAGAGIMMTALLSILIVDTLVRVNALRILLMGAVNGIAAVGFAFFGPVHWLYALPLGIGYVAGGYIGPHISRRLPATALMIIIAVGGFALAIDLAWQAYA
jgi:uncharacterized membrane protein YfcA